MKQIIFFIFLFFFTISILEAKSNITQKLMTELNKSENQGRKIPAIIFLEDNFEIIDLDNELSESGVSLEKRAYTVITKLKEHAEKTQTTLLDKLKSKKLATVHSLWINNTIAIEAIPSQIIAISNFSEISLIDLDEGPKIIKPVQESTAPSSIPNHSEIGLKVINAHKMWQLGFTGEGIIVMNMDTGVEGDHPALAATWRGNDPGVHTSAAWFDPQFSTNFPFDDNGHGSHTMGTMIGLDTITNDTIGAAFNAKWIAAKTHKANLAGLSTAAMISAFQWALDPDGDPNTTDDIPAVVNCSWGGYTTCSNPFISSINALEAAGIAVVFSIGNSGPTPGSARGPGMNNTTEMNVFSVGAVNGNNPGIYIAPFSSRGPTNCTGAGNNIKPEVSAPGNYVRSSVMNSGYKYFSGTSMAAPHVSGAIALLKQAFPQKTGAELKYMLYESAQDLGVPGEDNDYGMGLIDVYAAYKMNAGNLIPRIPENFDAYSDYTTPTSISLNWNDPINYVNGDSLINFVVDVFRDSQLIQSVSPGVENFMDSGLNDGQSYLYSLKTRDVLTDSTSIEIQKSVICGGSSFPAAPNNVACTYNGTNVTINWNDPTTQADGTPLDDLEKIYIYRYSVLIDSVNAGTESYIDTDTLNFMNTISYFLRAKDNEFPFHLSTKSKKSFCITTTTPDYLVWASIGSTSPYFSSPDSIFEAIVDNDESVTLTNNLFNYGNNLSIFKGIFVVLTYEYQYGGLFNNSSEAIALNSYLSSGGSLYLEGAWELFNIPPDIPLHDIRPWFSLNKPSTHTSIIASSITGYDFLSSFSFTYDGFFRTLSELLPQNSIPIWKQNDYVIGVYNPSYGSGDSFGNVFPFGGLVGREARKQLMKKYIKVITGIENITTFPPIKFELSQNYPNPFNPTTTIEFSIPKIDFVELNIYNILGQEVATLVSEKLTPGKYKYNWDASGFASGVYYYHFQTRIFQQVKKLILMK